jgi:hypothetical protein
MLSDAVSTLIVTQGWSSFRRPRRATGTDFSRRR